MNPFLPVALVAVATFLLVGFPGGSAMVGGLRASAPRGVGGRPGAALTHLGPTWSEALAHSPELAPFPELSLIVEREVGLSPPTEEDLHVEELVALAQSGDPDAFGALFEHFQGPIYRQLFFLTRSVSVAEDLTSETFFRALRAMRRSQVPGSYFGPWLRKIARNLAMDHASARSTKSEKVMWESFEWLDFGGPDPELEATLERDTVRTALSRLPETQRRVLAMRFLCQMSIEETATELGCTQGAAKQLQWRGLRNLERIVLEQSGD